jgi:hypothetical protein
MAKKGDKGNGAPNVTKQAPKAKKRRAAVKRETHPGIVVPAVAWGVILLAIGIGDRYLGFDRFLGVMIGGSVTVLFFVLAGVFYVKDYLHPKQFKPILTVAVLLALVSCIGLIWFGTWGGKPVVSGVVESADPTAQFELPKGMYRLFVQGAFADADPKTRGSVRSSGTYEFSLSSAEDPAAMKKYSGRFDHMRKKRKMARRSRGYQEILRTSDLYSFSGGGEHMLRLESSSEELSDTFEFAVYRNNFVAYPLILLGVLALLLGGFIDAVIRASRITSAVGQGIGAAFGFSIYFFMESSPVTGFQTMAFDILIGGIVGIAGSYGVYSVLKNWYQNLSRKKGIMI